MTKIVINRCFGGFGLSAKAVSLYCNRKGIRPGRYNESKQWYEGFVDRDLPRDDPILIEIVEQLGDLSFGPFAELLVVEIPNDVKWQIEEYDGREWIAEQHRVWP